MTPIDTMLSTVQWTENPAQESSDLPYATHSGVLEIMGKRLRCHRLNDGRAIFDADDVADFFEILQEPKP